jgi:hypothetical protein
MKLLFLSLSGVNFTVETPEQAPLGGSESCAAYLARQLAANGHVGDFLARPEEWAHERFAQVQEVNRRCSWQARAREWEAFLGPAIAWKKNMP